MVRSLFSLSIYIYLYLGESRTQHYTKQNTGGHWYDSSIEGAVDPWIQVGYKSTTSAGTAEFSDCVQVGFDVKSDPGLLEGRAFVVHANGGGRASCGLMTAAEDPDTMAPTYYKSSKSTKKDSKKGY